MKEYTVVVEVKGPHGSLRTAYPIQARTISDAKDMAVAFAEMCYGCSARVVKASLAK